MNTKQFSDSLQCHFSCNIVSVGHGAIASKLRSVFCKPIFNLISQAHQPWKDRHCTFCTYLKAWIHSLTVLYENITLGKQHTSTVNDYWRKMPCNIWIGMKSVGDAPTCSGNNFKTNFIPVKPYIITRTKCVPQNASFPSWHHVDHSNKYLIYNQNNPEWFYLCLMLFLKLSHKSSRIKRRKRWFSLPPPCISSSSSCRHSPRLVLTSRL